MKSFTGSFILVLVSAVMMACDPSGPGAIGTIDLGEEVDPARYQVLEIRLFEAESETWTPADGIPEEAVYGQYEGYFEDWEYEDYLETSETAEEHQLSDISFPYHYSIGPTFGSTHEKTWRVVAWLAPEPGSQAPSSGDYWGTQLVEFDWCGGFGGYCGDTKGIDIVIDQQVP